VVGLADEVVVVLVAADLLDELHAPSNAAHARNTTTVRHDRRTSDPTDMNPSSVPDYSGWSPCAVRSRLARVWSRFQAMVALCCTRGRNSQ
jgi:hypothetical protein